MYLLDGLQRSAHAAREMEEERKREREREREGEGERKERVTQRTLGGSCQL